MHILYSGHEVSTSPPDKKNKCFTLDITMSHTSKKTRQKKQKSPENKGTLHRKGTGILPVPLRCVALRLQREVLKACTDPGNHPVDLDCTMGNHHFEPPGVTFSWLKRDGFKFPSHANTRNDFGSTTFVREKEMEISRIMLRVVQVG